MEELEEKPQLVSWWCLSCFFLTTVNNARYIIVAFGSGDRGSTSEAERLFAAAKMGALLAAVSGAGGLLLSRAFDYLGSHKSAALAVQLFAVMAASGAALLSSQEPSSSWRVSSLVLLSFFAASGLVPVRDAVASKQALLAGALGLAAPSFGSLRLFLVLGAALLAVVSSYAMAAGGATGVLLVTAAVMFLAWLLFLTCFPEDVLRRLLQTAPSSAPAPRREEAAAVAAPPQLVAGKLPSAAVWLIFGACLCAGVANSSLELLLYPVLQQRGFPAGMLGWLHCLAFLGEVPVFALEERWLPLFGSYASAFCWAALALALRLGLALGLLLRNPSPSLGAALTLLLGECLHGLARPPGVIAASKLAALWAAKGQVTTVSALFGMAITRLGEVAGMALFLLTGGRLEVMLLLAIAEAMTAAGLMDQVRRHCSLELEVEDLDDSRILHPMVEEEGGEEEEAGPAAQ